METLTVGVREAARVLGIGRGRTYALVRAGRIPAVRAGKHYRVVVSALPKLLEEPEQLSLAAEIGGEKED